MDTLLAQLLEGWGTKVEPLTVCSLSEDCATGARAERFLKAIALQLPPGRGIDKRVWTLNELRMPRLRAIAAEEGAASECIIVSLRNAQSLPPHASAWLSAMLQKRRRVDGALVALLDSESAESAGLKSLLEQAALEARMRFLVHMAALEEENTPSDR